MNSKTAFAKIDSDVYGLDKKAAAARGELIVVYISDCLKERATQYLRLEAEENLGQTAEFVAPDHLVEVDLPQHFMLSIHKHLVAKITEQLRDTTPKPKRRRTQ